MTRNGVSPLLRILAVVSIFAGCTEPTSAPCTSTCSTEGTTSCSQAVLNQCARDADGCLSWTAPQACGEGFCADAATCGTCNNTCTQEGGSRCTSGQLSKCTAGAGGCLAWGAASACASAVCGNSTSCDQKPVANLSCPATVRVGAAASFSAAGSTDPDGTIASYAFDFGDGSSSGASASAADQHSFSTAGTFTVTLTVTDNAGATGQATCGVTIDATDGGADGGSSADAGCSALSCTTPPPATCVAGSVRTYGAGSCVATACEYLFTDAPCAFGCASNQCCSGFQYEAVTSDSTDFDFAADSAGGLHVAYYTGSALRYAYRATAAGGWTTSAVTPPSTPNAGSYPSIAVDPSGIPTIVYTSPLTTTLYLARGGASWTFETVDSQGSYPSVAIDAAGAMHLVYLKGLNLTYGVRPAGGSWAFKNVTSNTWGYPDLVVDAAGTAHICHASYSGTSIRYERGSASTAFVGEDAMQTMGTAKCTLALGSSGAVHIALSHYGLHHLERGATGTWTDTTVDSSSNTRRPGLALDARGVHLLYIDLYPTVVLRYARRAAGGSFAVQTVNLTVNGADVILLLDAAGALHGSSGRSHWTLPECQ